MTEDERDRLETALHDGLTGRITVDECAEELAAMGVTGLGVITATVEIDGIRSTFGSN